MAARTIALSSEELESTIEVLSSAAQALQLTRFERLSYRGLMVSVDVGAASFVAAVLLSSTGFGDEALQTRMFWAFKTLFLVFAASVLVGIVLLALNIPLIRKAFCERARLKTLGLSTLSNARLEVGSHSPKYESIVLHIGADAIVG